MKTSSPLHSRAGYTLVELVTAMVVLSIAVTVFAQRMQITDVREVELSASEMVRKIDMARARAIANRQSVRIKFNTGSGKYRAWVDHDRDGTINQNGTEMNAFPAFRKRDLRAKVKYGLGDAPRMPADSTGSGVVTFASKILEFDSRGIPTPFGTRGTVYLQHVDNPEVVAAIHISGSASTRMYRYVNGVWQ